MTATSIVVGCVIGAGVFFKPYAIYRATGGAPGMGILSWIIGFLACLYSLSGDFDLLTDLSVFSCWIFYTLTFACVIRLRHIHPEWERKYKVPFYPVIPALAIFSGLFVIFSQIFLSGTRARIMAVCSVVITIVGLPIYYAVRRRR